MTTNTNDERLVDVLRNQKRPKPTSRGPSPVFCAARHRGPACFAPPLDDARLKECEKLAASAPPAIAEPMAVLAALVRLFNETPESKLPGEPLQTDLAANPFRDPVTGEPADPPRKIPLEAAEIDRIWDAVPWPHELNAIGAVFETIDPRTDKALRDAAFHLLWFARELVLDREPMTQDKIGV